MVGPIDNNTNVSPYKPLARGGQNQSAAMLEAGQEQDVVSLSTNSSAKGNSKGGVIDWFVDFFTGRSAEASQEPDREPTEQEVFDQWVEAGRPPLSRAVTRFAQNRLVVEAEASRDGGQLHYADSFLSARLAAGETEVVRSIALAAVREDGASLRDVPQQFRSDPIIVEAAVRQNGLSIRYADESLQGNREIALLAIRENSEAIHYVSPSLFQDSQFLEAFYPENFYVLNYIYDQVTNNGRNRQAFIDLPLPAQASQRFLGLRSRMIRTGITYIERFPDATMEQVEELVRNRETSSRGDSRPVALVAMSESDGSGSFSQLDSHILDLMDQGFRVVYFEVGSEEDLYQAIETTGRQHEIGFLYIAGHGSPVSTRLVDSRARYNSANEAGFLDTTDGQEMRARNLNRYLSADAAVLLLSCRTGEGEDNLQGTLETVFTGHSVYAPNGSPIDFDIAYSGSRGTNDLSVRNISFTIE